MTKGLFFTLFLGLCLAYSGSALADSYTVKNNYGQKIEVWSTGLNFKTGQGNERKNYFEPTGSVSREIKHGEGFQLVTIYAYQHDNHGVSCNKFGNTSAASETDWLLEVAPGPGQMQMTCKLIKKKTR